MRGGEEEERRKGGEENRGQDRRWRAPRTIVFL